MENDEDNFEFDLDEPIEKEDNNFFEFLFVILCLIFTIMTFLIYLI